MGLNRKPRERDGESEAERESARVTDSERELGAERLKVKGWRKRVNRGVKKTARDN